MNCEDIEKYKEHLSQEILRYMSATPGPRSAEAISSMVTCYKNVSDMKDMITKDFNFTPEKAEHWLLHMVNEDGSNGPHWGLKDTDKFKPDGVSSYCWECAMNMMYSDYYSVAVKHGVNNPDFYADLAKAFLFDKDAKGPKEKIAAYYNCIVDTK